MRRLFSLCVVMFLLTLIVPVSGTIPEQQVQAAPTASGGIVLVARDIIDLKWDPTTFQNPAGLTRLFGPIPGVHWLFLWDHDFQDRAGKSLQWHVSYSKKNNLCLQWVLV